MFIEIKSFNAFSKNYGIEGYERSGCIANNVEMRCWRCIYKEVFDVCILKIIDKEAIKIEYRG